jgi:hypothetical protein
MATAKKQSSMGFKKTLHNGFYNGKTVNTFRKNTQNRDKIFNLFQRYKQIENHLKPACLSTICPYVNMNKCKISAKRFSKIS